MKNGDGKTGKMPEFRKEANADGQEELPAQDAKKWKQRNRSNDASGGKKNWMTSQSSKNAIT